MFGPSISFTAIVTSLVTLALRELVGFYYSLKRGRNQAVVLSGILLTRAFEYFRFSEAIRFDPTDDTFISPKFPDALDYQLLLNNATDLKNNLRLIVIEFQLLENAAIGSIVPFNTEKFYSTEFSGVVPEDILQDHRHDIADIYSALSEEYLKLANFIRKTYRDEVFDYEHFSEELQRFLRQAPLLKNTDDIK